jgi:hypothetical protein
MKITGIIVDKISGKTTLILSSWSSKIEIDLDTYIEYHGVGGGIAYFEKVN